MMDLSFFNRAISRRYTPAFYPFDIIFYISLLLLQRSGIIYNCVHTSILLYARCLYLHLPIRKCNRLRKMKKKSSRGLYIRSAAAAAAAAYILWPGC